MATREAALRRDMRGGRPLFDDEDEADRFSGTPTPLNSHSRPKAVIGAVSPPQTMHAITSRGGGKNGGGQQPIFGGRDLPAKEGRQAKPKGRTARKKEQREMKAAKKGGRR